MRLRLPAPAAPRGHATRALLVLWALAVLAATATAAPSAALRAAGDEYWSGMLRLHPSLALEEGDFTRAELFDDSLRDSWRVEMTAMLEAIAARLDRIDPASLDGEDVTSREMLAYQVGESLRYYRSAEFETARLLPIDHFDGPHLAFAHDAAGDGAYPFRTTADYERALLRAGHFASWVDDAIGRLGEGARRGVVLPRVVVERLLPQLGAHVGVAPEDSEFWKPLRAFPDAVPPADRERLRASYRDAIARVIEPAYRRLRDFLARDYRPHARASVGLGGVPGGRALYRHWVRYHTTTAEEPRAIHALGLAEVARIEREIEGVARSVGSAGPLPAFFARVRTDPAQHFHDPAEIVPAYEAARDRILGTLPRLFGSLPRAAYQIRALPESARASQGNGYYSRAAADGSRPGILWMNTYAPGVRDRFTVMTISLHEGLPGHHLQTALALEQEALPAFRRADFTNAYGEGWALYAESLGDELGVFDDPWQRYGHLSYEILRANRLVIDTGLHELGWTVERGVRFMMAHSSMTRAEATAEVERYVAYPGQALSYKVGELTIRRLRSAAERALGPRFDVRAFHDQVLLGGSMPLAILEGRVNRWVREAAGDR